MVNFFRKLKVQTFCFDPLFNKKEIDDMGLKNIDHKLKYDLVIIANNSKFFTSIKFTKLLKKITRKNTKVYDCWECLNNNSKKNFIYKTIGEI